MNTSYLIRLSTLGTLLKPSAQASAGPPNVSVDFLRAFDTTNFISSLSPSSSDCPALSLTFRQYKMFQQKCGICTLVTLFALGDE
ncbi:hypothetical protein BJV77DRAFT_1021506 [Russula vinacea]|jgi:hypothetical protein|nr:hypothetical protein BJV77DRAFT_1021506 [Russula vinacea]